MPSFDIVSETDMQEVDNAINSVVREMGNRYDFKGSKSTIERNEETLVIIADDDLKQKSIIEMVKTHFTRRNVDPKCLDFGEPQMASGGTTRTEVKIKKGIDQDNSKKITKAVKASNIKIQASIQGEQVRITGKKRDDLQQGIELAKSLDIDVPLQFVNFRD